VTGEPVRILVQLCRAQTRDATDPELVRRHVELVLRRAYPRVDVMVLWHKDLTGTRVHVVGDDPKAGHAQTVRHLVEFVVARGSRLVAGPDPDTTQAAPDSDRPRVT
jgi:hypothetical protein